MFNLFSSISCLYGIRTHLTWHYRVREIFCSTNNFELKKKSTRTRENLFCNFPFITLNLNQHPVADTNSLQVKRITFLFLNILIELHGLQSFPTKLRRKCLFVLATNIFDSTIFRRENLAQLPSTVCQPPCRHCDFSPVSVSFHVTSITFGNVRQGVWFLLFAISHMFRSA